MSIILDALKKLDRERAMRRGNPTNIAADILKSDPSRTGRRIYLSLAVVALATAAITYAVVGKFGFLSTSSLPPATLTSAIPPQESVQSSKEDPAPSKTTPAEPIPHPTPSEPVKPALPAADPMPKSSAGSGSPPAKSREVASAPLTKDPVSKPLPSASPGSSKADRKVVQPSPGPEPARDLRGAASQAPPQIPARAETQKREILREGPKPSREATSLKEAAIPTAAPPIQPEARSKESSSTPPTLKLSGIAWSEEPSNRLAVVNGNVLPEGGSIHGVKILEILPTGVRFLHNGQAFEIFMSP
jgi:hypothetical protein